MRLMRMMKMRMQWGRTSVKLARLIKDQVTEMAPKRIGIFQIIGAIQIHDVCQLTVT